MPPITAISSVPPDFARPDPRVRGRQRVAAEVVDQVAQALGSPAASESPQQARSRESLQPPLDLVQRLFTERQAVLREAALQRDAVLQQRDDDQQLRPIAQAQRDADRLQVLRDAQLLETQRLATQRLAPAQDAERLLVQREVPHLEEQRTLARTLEREDAARLQEQRAEAERDAQRIQEEQDAARVAEQRVEAEREAERVQEREEALRFEAQQERARVDARREQTRLEAERDDSERVLVERAALAYRSESQRAVAEATAARFEAERPLAEQLRVARERVEALEARRIDRVDVSEAALSRLSY